MIIKNNFNDKNVNPLDDYNSIGKGSHSLDKEFEKEREGFIKENMENPVLNDLDKEEIQEEDTGDNWKLFR